MSGRRGGREIPMRVGTWTVLVAGLLAMAAGCGDEEPWVAFCQRLSAEEAEHIITRDGDRLVEGDIQGTGIAMRAEETYQGRAIWAVVMKVGDTRLVLLHDTAASVEAPDGPEWRDGRWLSHNLVTRHALQSPLNRNRPDPYPDSVVEHALRCELSVWGF